MIEWKNVQDTQEWSHDEKMCEKHAWWDGRIFPILYIVRLHSQSERIPLWVWHRITCRLVHWWIDRGGKFVWGPFEGKSMQLREVSWGRTKRARFVRGWIGTVQSMFARHQWWWQKDLEKVLDVMSANKGLPRALSLAKNRLSLSGLDFTLEKKSAHNFSTHATLSNGECKIRPLWMTDRL